MGDGYGQVIQGHLESSNAVVTDELVKLMRAQQAYAGFVTSCCRQLWKCQNVLPAEISNKLTLKCFG